MNTKYTKGSGNVYEDLGFPDAEERLAKAKLAMRIESVIEQRKLKQAEAAELLGINQPKISALMNGRLEGFSMERLIHFLSLLSQDVEIIVRAKPVRSRKSSKIGQLKVAFA